MATTTNFFTLSSPSSYAKRPYFLFPNPNHHSVSVCPKIINPKIPTSPPSFPYKPSLFLSHTISPQNNKIDNNSFILLVSSSSKAASFSDDDTFDDNIDRQQREQESSVLVGIYGDPDAEKTCFLALNTLPHPEDAKTFILSFVDHLGGLVFGENERYRRLHPELVIGQASYHDGKSCWLNCQPSECSGDDCGVSFGIAINGTLVNFQSLRRKLGYTSRATSFMSNSKLVLQLFKTLTVKRPFLVMIVELCKMLEGSYSMLFIIHDKEKDEKQLIAVRGPSGVKPLVMGKRRSNGAVVFASDNAALDLIEATYEREVLPGEVLTVHKNGVYSSSLL